MKRIMIISLGGANDRVEWCKWGVGALGGARTYSVVCNRYLGRGPRTPRLVLTLPQNLRASDSCAAVWRGSGVGQRRGESSWANGRVMRLGWATCAQLCR